MKKVAVIPLALGVLIGGVAIKLGLDTLQEAKASGKQEVVSVVVSAAQIEATTQIQMEMLRVIETPVTPLLGRDSFSKVEDLIGRIPAVTIPKDMPIRDSLLSPKGTRPGLEVRIPKGYRAVSVKVNEVTGVAYQIRPGAFVDVIAVMNVNGGRKRETVSRIILQRIEVAAVGRALNLSNEAGGKSKAAKSITLLVKDSEAPKLHLAQTRGQITLALRSGDDVEKADEGHATESELLQGFENIAKTPKTDEATGEPSMVLVVNGRKVSQKQFGVATDDHRNAHGNEAEQGDPREPGFGDDEDDDDPLRTANRPG